MLLERVKRDQMAVLWKQMLPPLLKAIRTKAKMGDIIKIVEEESAYREIYDKWDNLTLEEMGDAWQEIATLMSKAAYATRPYCVRCGECCTKGSPVLCEEDLHLFSDGTLSAKDVFTLRIGEFGYSPQDEKNIVLEKELIKIKEVQDGPCIFYMNDQCGIYEDRPIQCRTLECWNPEGFSVIASLTPLNREIILTTDHPLWDVIAAHEKRTSHEILRGILESPERMDEAAEEKALDIILYDLHVRMFLEEKLEISKEELPLYFGYPVMRTLSDCGYSLEAEEGEETRIVKKDTIATER